MTFISLRIPLTSIIFAAPGLPECRVLVAERLQPLLVEKRQHGSGAALCAASRHLARVVTVSTRHASPVYVVAIPALPHPRARAVRALCAATREKPLIISNSMHACRMTAPSKSSSSAAASLPLWVNHSLVRVVPKQ
jgi:hypothetical protein